MIRKVLVTGADSGIGLWTLLAAAEMGFEVAGLVRDESAREALESAAGEHSVQVEVVVADLGDPQARSGAAAKLEPWALVNNAGYMNPGHLRDVPIPDAGRQLEVMVVAPIDLSLQVLPAMVSRGDGRIVNVTSSAVHSSTPLTGWYQASKAALRELNDSLRAELQGTGVDVIDVEPGGYRTEIWAGAERDLHRRRARSRHPRRYDRALALMQSSRSRMEDPSQAGRAVVEILLSGSPAAHRRVGPGARLLTVSDDVLADRLWDRALRAVLGPR